MNKFSYLIHHSEKTLIRSVLFELTLNLLIYIIKFKKNDLISKNNYLLNDFFLIKNKVS
jgi:hypothetical protein